MPENPQNTAKELWKAKLALPILFRQFEWLGVLATRADPSRLDALLAEHEQAMLEAWIEHRNKYIVMLGPYADEYKSVMEVEWHRTLVEAQKRRVNANNAPTTSGSLDSDTDLREFFENMGKEIEIEKEEYKRNPLRVATIDIDKALTDQLAQLGDGRMKAQALLEATLEVDFGQFAEDYEVAIWLSQQEQDTWKLVAQERQKWMAEKRTVENQEMNAEGSPWGSHIFWSARDEDEEFWAHYYLHFAIHFDIQGFEEVWEEIYREYEQVLRNDAQDRTYLLFLMTLDAEAKTGERLKSRLADEIRIACKELANYGVPHCQDHFGAKLR